MTKTEAFQILKCNHLDEVQEAYEDALFEYKAKFLQQIPPLKLIEAITKKVERINSAYYVLIPCSGFEKVHLDKKTVIDLANFLEDYHIVLSQIRLGVTSAADGKKLLNWIDELVILQINLFTKLSTYMTTEKLDFDIFPIKLSDEIDVFKLHLELKSLHIEDTEISEYICNQINELDFEQFAYLTQAVINAKKQMIFNGLKREI